MGSQLKTAAPDGGWGWMCVLGSTVVHSLLSLQIRCYGIFYLWFLERYQQSATATSWVGALNMLLWGLCGPLSNALCRRFSCRWVTIVGSLLYVGGFLGVAFAPSLAVIYVSFTIAGIGSSFAYMPGYIMVGEYFDKKKATAMSLSSVGAGIGAIIFPPILNILYEQYAYTGAMMIVASLMSHGCIAGALYRPLRPTKFPTEEVQIEMTNIEDGVYSSSKDIVHCDQDNMKDGTFIKGRLDTNVPSANKGEPTCKERTQLKKNNEIKDTETCCDNTHGKTNEPKVVTCSESYQSDSVEETQKHLLSDHKVATDGRTEQYNDINTIDIQNQQTEDPQSVKVEETDRCRAGCSACCRKHFSLLSNKIFLAAFLMNIGTTYALQATVVYLPAMVIQRGLTRAHGAWLLSVVGIMDTVSRLFTGSLLDLKLVKRYRVHVYNFCSVLVGVCAFCLPLYNSFVVYAMWMAMRGLTGSVFLAQRATIMSDILGAERAGEAFGWLLMGNALGSLLGRTIGGVVRDNLQDYQVSFYIAGVFNAICCLVFQISYMCMRRKASRKDR